MLLQQRAFHSFNEKLNVFHLHFQRVIRRTMYDRIVNDVNERNVLSTMWSSPDFAQISFLAFLQDGSIPNRTRNAVKLNRPMVNPRRALLAGLHPSGIRSSRRNVSRVSIFPPSVSTRVEALMKRQWGMKYGDRKEHVLARSEEKRETAEWEMGIVAVAVCEAVSQGPRTIGYSQGFAICSWKEVLNQISIWNPLIRLEISILTCNHD